VKGVIDNVFFEAELQVEDVVAADEAHGGAVAAGADTFVDGVPLQRFDVDFRKRDGLAADLKPFPGDAALEKTHLQKFLFGN
jgi:hypothetical protein